VRRAPIDRGAPPAPGRLRPFTFPYFRRERAGTDLDLVLLPHPTVPLVFLELLLPRGADREPASSRGLATLTASLLDEGTRRRSSQEIAAAVEGLGSQLHTTADWDGTYLSATVGAADVEAGLELLAEVALEPTFPEWEIDRLRRQRLAELQRRSAQPEFLASRELARVIYGDHVYGETLLGDPDSVAGLERGAVGDWYEGELRPAGRVLIAVGDFEPARVHALASARLLGRGGVPDAQPAVPSPPLGGRRVLILDRPEAPQTELRLGHAGIPVRHPDRIPLQVANVLLGGSFMSRINLALRERLGITYGASSRLATRRGPGPFVVGAAVDSEAVGTAVREVLREVAHLREELAEPVEVADAKSYLVGTFPYTVQTLDGLAGRLEELVLHDLPENHFQRLPEEVEAVDAGAIRRVAAAHLDPERLAVVAVGPARLLAPQLDGLGEIIVRDGRRGAPAVADDPASQTAAV
jgi:zinc protease